MLISLRSRYLPDFDTPRFRLTPSHPAYVKIAEGCNHPCSFCVIPQMRGRHRSRTVESVVAEVRNLVAEGVKEINLISQDTTYFGMDLWTEKAGPRQPVDSRRGPTLVRLLDELATIEGEFWVRLLYTHPAHWSDELIAAIARNPKVARYVDMPLQHIHGDMLSAMRRETSREHIEDLISRLRAGIPGLAIRTTFIVGFPGETEEHFSSLLDFIEEDAVRAARDFQLFAGGGFPRRQDAGTAFGKGQKPPVSRGHEASATDRRGTRGGAEGQDTSGSGRSAPDCAQRPRRAGRRLPRGPDRRAPVGEFADVRVTGSHVYDLLAESRFLKPQPASGSRV